MKYYSVTEALIYLNEILPGVAPRNEETIRRAIRNGELKAEQRLGRDGNRIEESDLIEYSKKYQLKAAANNLKFKRVNTNALLAHETFSDTDFSASEIMKKYEKSGNTSKEMIQNDLQAAKKQWQGKINLLQSKILFIKNEIFRYQKEINSIDQELSKL